MDTYSLFEREEQWVYSLTGPLLSVDALDNFYAHPLGYRYYRSASRGDTAVCELFTCDGSQRAPALSLREFLAAYGWVYTARKQRDRMPAEPKID